MARCGLNCADIDTALHDAETPWEGTHLPRINFGTTVRQADQVWHCFENTINAYHQLGFDVGLKVVGKPSQNKNGVSKPLSQAVLLHCLTHPGIQAQAGGRAC